MIFENGYEQPRIIFRGISVFAGLASRYYLICWSIGLFSEPSIFDTHNILDDLIQESDELNMNPVVLLQDISSIVKTENSEDAGTVTIKQETTVKKPRRKSIKPAHIPFSDKVEFVSHMCGNVSNRADYRSESTAVILSMTAQFIWDMYELQEKTNQSCVSILDRFVRPFILKQCETLEERIRNKFSKVKSKKKQLCR